VPQEEVDLDALTYALYKNKYPNKSDLIKNFCGTEGKQNKNKSKRCGGGKKRVFLPEEYAKQRKDESFEALSDKEIQMEKLMAKMKAAGMVRILI
jgi:hypothetical protein